MDDIVEVAIPELNNLSTEQLKEKISILSQTEDGEPLAKAMFELKKALKENPAACSLLLPEDIGQCVAALRRYTNRGILEDLNGAGKRKPKSDRVQIKKEDLDNLTMDDLL